jgi:DNA-directed RNA polymerase sigma subunit (sigma70/sigma32)
MLDIDTLNALSDLMAKTLYSAEVARLPKLTRAEEAELVRRAREGDTAARAALIVSCLASVFLMALRFYLTYRPVHDDALDLVQNASLEMLMALDRALMKRHPGSYLRGIARKAMVVQTLYYSELIRKPEFPLAKLAATPIPTVESLDAPAFRESTTLKIDLIEMAPPPDEKENKRFAPLYEALARLTPRQRHNIARQFGVGESNPAYTSWQGVRRQTLDQLRTALEPYLKHMLSPEQEE